MAQGEQPRVAVDPAEPAKPLPLSLANLEYTVPEVVSECPSRAQPRVLQTRFLHGLNDGVTGWESLGVESLDL